jgi:uncharacterized protein
VTGRATVEVRDHAAQLQYELLLDGEVAGVIRYRRDGETVALIHTDLAPELEGRGLGGRLVAGALDDIRARGLGVVPICPFARSYIDRHPEFRDLVVPDTEVPY